MHYNAVFIIMQPTLDVYVPSCYALPLFVQIVDDNLGDVGPGVEGQLAVRVKPHRPIGLFTRYVVSWSYLLSLTDFLVF